MRVIGGILKSRKLYFPKTFKTRPVTDRAKETIFNVLGELVGARRVLDLFAGSGSLGIEAISRGAEGALFVDNASICTQCIERNLKNLEISRKGSVLKSDISQAIEKLEKQSKKFTLIFLDPPHNKGFIKKTLHRLDGSDIVALHGIIVAGHSDKEGLPEKLKTQGISRINGEHLHLPTKVGEFSRVFQPKYLFVSQFIKLAKKF